MPIAVKPRPGACVEVDPDGRVVFKSWNIDGGGADVASNSKEFALAILDWLARAVERQASR